MHVSWMAGEGLVRKIDSSNAEAFTPGDVASSYDIICMIQLALMSPVPP